MIIFLPNQRQKLILSIINEIGSISIQDLIDELDVSKMTIWRDLKFLDEKGLIKKVHGGAMKNDAGLTETNSADIAFEQKKGKAKKEKQALSEFASNNYVDDGDIIVIGGGSTVYFMIQHLKNKNITILTNGFNLMHHASRERINANVISSGGFIRYPSSAFCGPDTIEFFKRYTVNKAFLSATSISLKDGIRDPHPLDSEVKRVIKEITEKLILLVDSSKFNERSLTKAFELEEFDVIITDNNTPKRIVGELRERGIHVDVVEVN